MSALAGARHAAQNAVAWTAGRISAVVARLSYAMVEGFVFALSKPTAGLVVAAELAAFAVAAGPRTPIKVAAATALAAGTFRTWQCLFHSFRNTGLGPHAFEDLGSIWDWEPPQDDSSASSAWHILRQLAVTANTLRQQNPAVQRLLDQPSLAANELAMRLFYFYNAVDEPLLSAEEAACVEAVPPPLKQQLAHYRDMACLIYDFASDDTLGAQLAERGFKLVCASYTADLASGCPAYCLAISEEQQEVVVVIRGTFSPEDAFFDLLANGSEFDDDGASPCPVAGSEQQRLRGYCHEGMGRGALFLGAKFGPVLHPLWSQGYKVTLVGHSLGAGVASLLCVYLRNRGMGPERLHCWAYETPACMDLKLAEACTDVVTSLVHCDDMVPRMCIRSFAGFLEELSAFDWQTEAARQAKGNDADRRKRDRVAQHLSKLLLYVFGAMDSGKSGQGGEEADEEESEPAGEAAGSGSLDADTDEALHAAAEATGQAGLRRLGSEGFDRGYNAHVPGRVVLIYRPPDGSSEEPDGLAVVPTTHRAVRRLRVSSSMITDHFVDTVEVIATLSSSTE